MKHVRMMQSVAEWEQWQPEIPTSGVIIGKFSPRCPISRGVERDFDAWYEQLPADAAPLCIKVDVIAARSLSQHLAQIFQIPHKSPQIIWLTPDLQVSWAASHYAIRSASLTAQLQQIATQG